ncbi:MAG: hypothetical protein ACK5MR_17730 [Cumulibacter sp.]
MAQFEGKYELKAYENGDTDDNVPENAITGEYTYSGNQPKYKRISSNQGLAQGGSEVLEFAMPYVVEHGLPEGLSSHGALYKTTAADEVSQSSFGAASQSGADNGARPTNVMGI